jgi:hypothetical protein
MLLEVLGAVGVTNILVRGSVFAWLRRAWGLRLLLNCAMCTGWWVGMGLGIVHMQIHQRALERLLEVLVDGGAVSALATLLDFTLASLDSHTNTGHE